MVARKLRLSDACHVAGVMLALHPEAARQRSRSLHLPQLVADAPQDFMRHPLPSAANRPLD